MKFIKKILQVGIHHTEIKSNFLRDILILILKFIKHQDFHQIRNEHDNMENHLTTYMNQHLTNKPFLLRIYVEEQSNSNKWHNMNMVTNNLPRCIQLDHELERITIKKRTPSLIIQTNTRNQRSKKANPSNFTPLIHSYIYSPMHVCVLPAYFSSFFIEMIRFFFLFYRFIRKFNVS